MRGIVLLFIFFPFFAQSQVGIRLIHVHPKDELGFWMDKSFAGEILYLAGFELPVRARLGLGYYNFHPRMEVFPTTKHLNGTNFNTTGTMEIKKFNYTILTLGFDYELYYNKKMSIYTGADFILGGANIEYEYVVHGVQEEFGILGVDVFGGRLRAGGEYKLNGYFFLFTDLNFNFYRIVSSKYLMHNELSLGLRISFRE